MEESKQKEEEANKYFSEYVERQKQNKDNKKEEIKNNENNDDSDENDLAKNIIMIQRYENSPFSEYLVEKGTKFNVQNKSEKQIKQLLQNNRLLIQNKHIINISDLIAFVTIEKFENVSMSANIDISGLSKLCQQDKIFKDHLNEFLIEYGLNLDVLKDVKYKLFLVF